MTAMTRERAAAVAAVYAEHAEAIERTVTARVNGASAVTTEDACHSAWATLPRRPDVDDDDGVGWLIAVASHEGWRLASSARETPVGAFMSAPADEDREAGVLPEPAGEALDPAHRALDGERHRDRVAARDLLPLRAPPRRRRDVPRLRRAHAAGVVGRAPRRGAGRGLSAPPRPRSSCGSAEEAAGRRRCVVMRLAFLSLVLALLLPAAAAAAPGDLDLGFANGGVQTTNFGPGPSSGKAVVRQPDGRIVVAGDSVGGFALARYETDGSLDTSFAGDGRQTTGFGRGRGGGTANGVALQDDGKIVAVGRTGSQFALARHHTDGSLDTSFGDGGTQVTDFGPGFDQATGVALQADGKIVVVGTTGDADGFDETFAVARYNPDGSLDTTFSDDGMQTTDFGARFVGATGVAVQDDGRIVAVGGAGNFDDSTDFALARYNPDGSLDTSFSGDGKQTTDFRQFDGATGVALQDDGKIVAVGTSGSMGFNDFTLARYNPDGSLDPSFSDDGKQTTDFDVDDDAQGVALQSDGKIVVVGDTNDDTGGTSAAFAVARYETDGTLDTTFSDDGMQTTGFGGSFASAAGVATGADGKTVAVGTVGIDLALARYNPDGSLDTPFSDDGKQTTTFDGNDSASGVTVQADGKIVAVGGGAPGSIIGAGQVGRGTFALARYDPDGSPDTSFADDGTQTTSFGEFAPASDVAVQDDGKIVAVGRVGDTGSQFALARYQSDGSPDPSFSVDGKETTDLGGYAGASAVALQDDGKIVAVGFGGDDFALARYNADGSLDTSFSDDGTQTTDFGDLAGATDVALQSDGKVVVVGRVGTQASGGDFAVARYNPDGSLDTSFSDDGRQTTDFGSPFAGATGVAVQDDGKIVAVGSGGDPNTEFALARYNPDGSLDASFAGDGRQTTEVGASGGASAVALQGDGKLVVVGGAADDIVLARYLPDGSLDTTFSADGTQSTDLGGIDSAAAVALQADGGIVVAGTGPGIDSPDFVVARYEGDRGPSPPPGGPAPPAGGPAPPPGSPVPPATPPLVPPLFAAKLEIARADVLRSKRRLSVLAPITARASGVVGVAFRAAGRTVRFDAEIDAGARQLRIERRIPAAQARLGTGILTLTYAGDEDTQPQEVRLRAASRPAALEASRPRILDGRLTAAGKITRRARGAVRLQLLFEPPGQPTRRLAFRARIRNGAYRFDERLPADVLAGIAQRRGVVHSYTLFTGYFKNRIRGELTSFEVLGAR